MVMGHIARAWYCGWVPAVGMELSREVIDPALIKKLRELQDCAQVLAKVCEEATRTANSLTQRSARLRSDKVMGIRDRDDLRDMGRKLIELDALVERLGRTNAPLQAFSHMYKVLMHNLRSEQLSEMGKESADCYRQLGEGVLIMAEWLKHTIGLEKPVALRVVSSPSQPKKELSP